MRLTPRAASCLAALALSCVPTTAVADPTACGPTGGCAVAHCHAGESYEVRVFGWGRAHGSVACGDGAGTECTGYGACVGGPATAEADGDLRCDLTDGLLAVCSTTGAGWGGLETTVVSILDLAAQHGLLGQLDPFTCLVLQAAGVPAAVNASTAVTGIRMDADDCDLYDGTRIVKDFSPYGA